MNTEQAQALIISTLLSSSINHEDIVRKLAAKDPILLCNLMGLQLSGLSWCHEAIDCLRKNQKIGAIKAVRVGTGAGLKEAKDAIDYFTNYDTAPSWGNMYQQTRDIVSALEKANGHPFFVK